MSVVIEDPSKRVRRLPSIYLGPSPVFVTRKPEQLKALLHRTLGLLRTASERSTFALTPIRLDEHLGLYARDMAVRETFRNYLKRLGATFADEPFVELLDDERLQGSWGEFSPEFMILGHYDEEEPERVLETSGAFVPFALAQFRLGHVSVLELKRLVGLCDGPLVMSSANPIELVGALRLRLGK